MFCHIVKINYVAIRKPVCSRQTVDRSPSPQPPLHQLGHQPLTAPRQKSSFSLLLQRHYNTVLTGLRVSYHSPSLFVPVTASLICSRIELFFYFFYGNTTYT